jgi:tripartite-type tricarboxylate transporter receptor subunit TctC
MRAAGARRREGVVKDARLRPALLASLYWLRQDAGADGATDFPVKPMRFVVGASAGSQSDILARLVGQKMSESWGRPVIVDNRSGAGGGLAAGMVARAQPDGYTLLFASPFLAIGAALQPHLPYDTLRDFSGVTQLGYGTGVLAASPTLGVRSVGDLVALAKSQPGRIIYGSGGIGQPSHLNGEKFRLAAGVDVVNVPFKAGADSVIETVASRVHYSFSGLVPALPFIRDGKLLALAVTTPQRSPVLPDVPALAEVLRDFGYEGAYALVAPAKTPRTIVDRLNREVVRILQLPDVRERTLGIGFVSATSTPEEQDRALKEQIARLSRLAKDAGLLAQR